MILFSISVEKVQEGRVEFGHLTNQYTSAPA